MSVIDEAKDYFERINKDKYLVVNGVVTAPVKALIKLFPDLLKEISKRDKVIEAALRFKNGAELYESGLPEALSQLEES